MQDHWSFVRHYPWLWPVAGLELAIWIGAVVTLVRAGGGRRAAAPVRTAALSRIRALRLGYLAATGAVGIDAWYVIARVIPAYSKFAASGALAPTTLGVHGVLGLSFLTLTWRPYGWGKLLAGFVGLVWILSALASALLNPEPAILWRLIPGLILVGAAALHQVVDPRFDASYLRARPD